MKPDKSKRMQKYIVAFIAFIMITSVIGFLYTGSASQKVNYNGYKMVQKGNSWVTNIDKKEAIFQFFPSEVADIEVSAEIITQLQNALEIDITSAENDTYAESIALAGYEFSQELGFHYNKFIRTGFISNSTFNLPIITCDDSTLMVPVVYFIESNQTKVFSQNSCIIAESESAVDIIRIKDRLLYGIHKIIR